jgi:AcrR family transcriptional regulator
MSAVKPRKYASRLRQDQARLTRLRIIESAERLFAERGYATTTIEAVAGDAGVAVDTVYATFGNKRGILFALLSLRVGGDDQPVSILDRPGPQATRAEPDQRRQLAMFATDIARVIERFRPVDDIIRSAAAVDPEVANTRTAIQEDRFRNMRTVVGWIEANGPLRDGVTTDDAAAILWTLTSPDVQRLFRDLRGWSQERYARWIEETAVSALLPPATITP